jgi:hypothetical protein
LPVESTLLLVVVDMLGRSVAGLKNGIERYNTAVWTASGSANGIYHCRLHAAPLTGLSTLFEKTRKLALLK